MQPTNPDIEFWNIYYESHRQAFKPSLFSQIIPKFVPNLINQSIIDLGCGNGRDSLELSRFGLQVTGLDQCEEEINYLNKNYANNCLRFICGDLTQFGHYDYAYLRFILHAISEDTEALLLNNIKDNITHKIFIESRSNLDPTLHETADHYRRPIVFEVLLQKMIQIGFKIIYAELSDQFSPYEAVYNAINNFKQPPIIRIVASNFRRD